MNKLEIIGKRWFQSSYGNTYHTVKVWVDDKLIVSSDINYGYDSQYVDTAISELVKHGYTNLSNLNSCNLRSYCEANNIVYSYFANDVKRKKDL